MEQTSAMVFVVDDDAAVRTAVARLLHSVGMQVATCASAREFLACSLPDGPACLVLDVRLAGENGLVLQETLRSATRRLPIIFLTGHGTVPLCAQALKAGAVDFLQKPCDEQDLLAAVATALAQDRRSRDTQRTRAALHERLAALTPRERDVMGLVVMGLLNKQIAGTLGTSEKTIKVHRARVMEKMQAVSLAELVRMADTVGLGAPTPAPLRPFLFAG